METIFVGFLYFVVYQIGIFFSILTSPYTIVQVYPTGFFVGVLFAFVVSVFPFWKKRISISFVELFSFWVPLFLLIVFIGSFIAGVVLDLIPLKYSYREFYRGISEI